MSHASKDPDLRALLPLKPKVFMVLLAMRERPLHGYAIRKEVLDRSEGTVELDPGGLYRLIARLEADGWIVPSEDRPPEESDDGRRNYYELTSLGRQVLAAEARRMARLVAGADVAAAARGATR